MKTKMKALTLVLCAMLLVCASVMGTLAYLKSTTEVVKNTFTVGNVTITLDETDVDIYGAKDGDTRVIKNAYKLIPGHTYIKDPIVHVQANSEACFVFVKLVNGIEDILDDVTIEQQILNNEWTALPGYDGVYYKNVSLADAQKGVDLKVFESFTLTEDAVLTDENGTAIYSANTPITITGYAIQSDGFEGDPVAAWVAGAF